MRIIKYEKGIVSINSDCVQLDIEDINKIEFYLEMVFVSNHSKVVKKSTKKTTKKKTTQRRKY